MARQNEFMFSGLERELELYMGEEHEAPRESNGKQLIISVVDTAGSPMSFTFSIDQNKHGYVHTSEHTYTKRTGLATKTYRVPGVTQLIVALNKKGYTAFIVLRDLLQFNENYNASKSETPDNVRFNVVKQNALTQFEILESKSVLKVSVFVNGKWESTEYPLQEPVAKQIQDLKAFIGGLQLDPDKELSDDFYEEYTLHPDEDSEFNYEKKEDLTVKKLALPIFRKETLLSLPLDTLSPRLSGCSPVPGSVIPAVYRQW
ncbi:MAG: hypothetical protein MRK02_04220 [Candidatus Scalindua sp.]|nr:hypothetical protein [Candidatus Scalindua sp.]